MSGTTLSGYYFSPVTLSDAATQNPATIAASGGISAAGTALLGEIGTVWTIANYGSVHGTGANGTGVVLGSGGTITNAGGGLISGDKTGIYLAGAGSVVNAGAVVGAGKGTGSSVGVLLADEGAVTNQSSGSIYGFTRAIDAHGAATVVNYGSITSGTTSAAVILRAGGQITNAAAALIQGGNGTDVYVTGASGTITNAGVIRALTAGNGINLHAGGLISNAASGTISASQRAGVYIAGGAGTVVNDGIVLSTLSTAVVLEAGGAVTNTLGGTIAGHLGIYAINAAISIWNAGLIESPGTSGNGIQLLGGGFVDNVSTGTISASRSAGLFVAGAVGTVVNAGQLWSTLSTAAVLDSGGIVTNQSGGAISGSVGVYIAGATGTIFNDGSITATGTFQSAIFLEAGGYVRNASDGSVAGDFVGSDGVEVHSAAGTVINSGRITGTAASGGGVYLFAGGSVTNTAAGLITGNNRGVVIVGGDGATLTNYGSISALHYGAVELGAGGVITNAASALLTGQYGVSLPSGGTLTNAGTIVGTGGTAVHVGGTSASRLVLDPGAVFAGGVNGGDTLVATAVSTLELASGASSGTLSGLGTQFVDFAQTTIDPGASWTLAGANTIVAGTTLTELSGARLVDTGVLENDGAILLDPSALAVAGLTGAGSVTIEAGSTLEVQGTITGGETIVFGGRGAYLHLGGPGSVTGSVTNFDSGETIDLKGIDASSVTYSSGLLSFAGGGFAVSLAGAGTVIASASGDGAAVSVLCFAADTLILTPSGERPVQSLAEGDWVMTHSGVARRIEWFGEGRVLATRRRRGAATPVIVRKGALADNVPHSDLRVTKGHSLFIDGVLIPVEFLVNHRSILWDDRAQEVEIYHIELATHDVLVANGAPAESYRDDGNRWLFQNGNTGWDQPAKPPCAPVLTGAPIVDAIWRRLLDRSGLWLDLPTTNDPDLHLVVDGIRVDARVTSKSRYTFRLPGRPDLVRVVSRAGAQDELGLARDPRQLGIALRRIALWRGRDLKVVEADDERLCEGFHAFEADNEFRWTDGNARLPAALFDGMSGTFELEVEVASTTQYPLSGDKACGVG